MIFKLILYVNLLKKFSSLKLRGLNIFWHDNSNVYNEWFMKTVSSTVGVEELEYSAQSHELNATEHL